MAGRGLKLGTRQARVCIQQNKEAAAESVHSVSSRLLTHRNRELEMRFAQVLNPSSPAFLWL